MEQKIHVLKTWPEYFQAVKEGIKNFEVRVNDRDYQVGDRIDLMEYDPNTNKYSGDHLHKEISYILPLYKIGILNTNQVVISIKNLE